MNEVQVIFNGKVSGEMSDIINGYEYYRTKDSLTEDDRFNFNLISHFLSEYAIKKFNDVEEALENMRKEREDPSFYINLEKRLKKEAEEKFAAIGESLGDNVSAIAEGVNDLFIQRTFFDLAPMFIEETEEGMGYFEEEHRQMMDDVIQNFATWKNESMNQEKPAE